MIKDEYINVITYSEEEADLFQTLLCAGKYRHIGENIGEAVGVYHVFRLNTLVRNFIRISIVPTGEDHMSVEDFTDLFL